METVPVGGDAPPHILVVDDDRSVAALITEILDGAGYPTTIASSYDGALAVANRRTIDLVISDVVLGTGGDGTDVVEGIRALQAARERCSSPATHDRLFPPETRESSPSRSMSPCC
jgi:CheY-like chemotaxis protein